MAERAHADDWAANGGPALTVDHLTKGFGVQGDRRHRAESVSVLALRTALLPTPPPPVLTSSVQVTFPSEVAQPPHSRRQTAPLSIRPRPTDRGRFASIWEPLATRHTIVVYAVVGIGSNLAYVALFRLMQPTLNALAANVVALVVTTVGNTAAHRRYTFGIRGRARLVVAHVGGLAAMSISLALSTAALAELDALDSQPSMLLASTTLWVAAALGAWMRFGPLRAWMGAAAMDP